MATTRPDLGSCDPKHSVPHPGPRSPRPLLCCHLRDVLTTAASLITAPEATPVESDAALSPWWCLGPASRVQSYLKSGGQVPPACRSEAGREATCPQPSGPQVIGLLGRWPLGKLWKAWTSSCVWPTWWDSDRQTEAGGTQLGRRQTGPEGPVRVGRQRSFPGSQPCSEIRNYCFGSLCLSSSSAPDPRATRGILDFFPFRKSYLQTEPAVSQM